jgi:hypothetical protein
MNVKFRWKAWVLRKKCGVEPRPSKPGGKKRQRCALAVLQKFTPVQPGKTPLLPRPAQKNASIFAA